ncbi:hypothetical protein [Mesorhizobium sp. KR2-14]|uniref:hypothetical protein n=1 Tax=Mesorhizobium sp. KR2-14 TaxID=3156610 RepID=UPI0032B39348
MRDIEEEVLRDPDLSQQSAAVGQILEDTRVALDEINQRLVLTHGISAVREHRDLLLELKRITLQVSIVSLSPNDWEIPKDAMGWKETKEQQIKPAFWQTSDLIDRIDGDLQNETFFEALRVADPDMRFPDAFSALYILQEIFAAAMSIRSSPDVGQPPRGGNRPNPKWMRDFGAAAQRFWYTHVSKKGTRPRFVPGGTADEGDNDITRWIIDVYNALVPMSRRNYAMLRTELLALRAYEGNGVKSDPS